jgi:capsid assembly protease
MPDLDTRKGRTSAMAAMGLQYPRIASRLFGVPLCMHPRKYEVMCRALSAQLGASFLSIDGQQSQPVAGDLFEEMANEARAYRVGRVGVVPVDGALVHRSSAVDAYSGVVGWDGLWQQVKAIWDDPATAAIIMRLRTPGGECNGMLEFADKLAALRDTGRMPIVACADPFWFSAGGVGIATSCSARFIPRTATVGAYGVITGLVSWQQQNEMMGLDVRIIYAGEKKADGNPNLAITDQAVLDMQRNVDGIYQLACESVDRRMARPAGWCASTLAGDFLGADAVAAGLADDIATFDDVLDYLVAATGE